MSQMLWKPMAEHALDGQRRRPIQFGEYQIGEV